MPLPTGFTRSSVTIKGQDIPFRALSRSEGVRLTSWDKADADGAEVWLVVTACDVPEEEAKAFLTGTDLTAGTELLTAILELSGLSTPEGQRDPKRRSNGR